MTRRSEARKLAAIALVVIALATILILAKPLAKFTGYNVVDTRGGYITELNISSPADTSYWAGFYGLTLMAAGFNDSQQAIAQPGIITQSNFVYNCLEPDIPHELYASRVDPNTLDFSTAQAASPRMVDEYINVSVNRTDSGTRTLGTNVSFLLGGRNISTNGTFTKQAGVNDSMFPVGVINVSNQAVFVTVITDSFVSSYKGSTVNYQMLLPVKNTSTTYYVIPDPYDSCPTGTGIGVTGSGFINGYVRDNATGSLLANVTINFGGQENITNEAGFYNFSARAGNFSIVGTKSGYTAYLSFVNLSPNRQATHNFSINPSPVLQASNGTARGRILENHTGAPIANATISIGGRIIQSNSTGNFSINITAGSYELIATRQGYITFFTTINVEEYGINSTEANMTAIYATVNGTVIDNSTGLGLSDVTITIGPQSSSTGSNGNFNMSIVSGSHIVLATKSGFTPFFSEISADHGQLIALNITMEPLTGNVYGIAKDNASGNSLEGVTVSIAGLSVVTNSSGFYNITTQTGSHTIGAVKSGYSSFAKNISIRAGLQTEQNISLQIVEAAAENGTVEGYAKDTSGQPISGATISVAGNISVTGSNGFYNVTLPEGGHNIVATKSGYNAAFASVTIVAGQAIKQNLTMNVTLTAGNGTIRGYVKDNNTNVGVANVSVSIGGRMLMTNANGYYNATIPAGNQTIAAVKSGYASFVGSAIIQAGNTTEYNITLYESAEGEIGENGTLEGFVKDTDGNAIANTTMSVAGNISMTSASGFYNVTLPEGTHNLVATKSGYNPAFAAVQITAGQATRQNITMNSSAVSGNGTVAGYVKDSSNLSISNATVSIAGLHIATNGSGYYNASIPAGNQTIAAVKSGYTSFVGSVMVTAGSATDFNISLAQFVEGEEGAGNGTVEGFTKVSTGALLSDVTVSIYGQSKTTNTTGFFSFSIPAGKHNVVATRSGYNTFAGQANVTAGNTTSFNVTMTAVTETLAAVTEGGAGGAGAGSGAGAGAGAARRAATVITQGEKPKEATDYKLSVSRIMKQLRQGTFTTVPIDITNLRTTTMSLSFRVEGDVTPFVSLDRERMVIDPQEKGTLTVTLLGDGERGIYNGTLLFSGDIVDEIPIDLVIYSKEKLPIEVLEVEIDLLEKNIIVGGVLKYEIELRNLVKDEEFPVILTHAIVNSETGERFQLEQEEMIVKTSASRIKNFALPKGVGKGDYVLSIDAEYLGLKATHNEQFHVSEPLYKYAVFGILPLWSLAAGILAITLGMFAFLSYRQRQLAKRRYKITVDIKAIPKEGPRSAWIGKLAESETKAYLDLDLFQIHTLIAGASGGGKTIAAKVLVEEVLLHGGSVIIFDPSAQWTGLLRKSTDKRMLAFYPAFGMKINDARGFNGNLYQVTDQRMRVNFNKLMKPGEVVIFVTNKLDALQTEYFVGNAIKDVFRSNLPESKQLKYLLVYDGIHNLLPKYGGSGKVFVQIERAAREFRKWGVGLLLISQVLADFAGELKANLNTEIQMRTRDENDLKRVKESYGEEALKSLVKAAIGTSMIANSAYNKGKPFFASWRPLMHSSERLTDDELANYNKYNIILDDLEYQLGQLKEEGIDIFDFTLELKLAKDKVKSGNFNMVGIYLDSLTPRITAAWEKLGKTPKKYVVELVKETEEEEAPREENKEKKEDKEAKEKPKEEPKQNQQGDFAMLIKKARMQLQQGDKEGARKTYTDIEGKYKLLGEQERKAYLKYCIEIRNQL